MERSVSVDASSLFKSRSLRKYERSTQAGGGQLAIASGDDAGYYRRGAVQAKDLDILKAQHAQETLGYFRFPTEWIKREDAYTQTMMEGLEVSGVFLCLKEANGIHVGIGIDAKLNPDLVFAPQMAVEESNIHRRSCQLIEDARQFFALSGCKGKSKEILFGALEDLGEFYACRFSCADLPQNLKDP